MHADHWITMKGTSVKRILSSAVKVAGSLGVIGGAMAFAAAPAGAAPTPTYAYGLSAFGVIHIAPVAHVNVGSTPQVAAAFVYPGFVTTGGILDRAKRFQAYSQVGAVKVYGLSQVEQLNASWSRPPAGSASSAALRSAMRPSRPARSWRPTVPFFPPIPLIRNPAPNTVINLGSLKITLNKQTFNGPVLTVTGIYITVPGQDLSIAVSRCGVPDVGPPTSNG